MYDYAVTVHVNIYAFVDYMCKTVHKECKEFSTTNNEVDAALGSDM